MLEKGIHEIGKIKIKDKLVVSDPCYSLNDWTIILNDMLEGNYKCFFERGDSYRIFESWIVHENYNTKKDEIEEIKDYIGVDSAQAGFFNYDYFKENSELSKKDKDKYNEEYYYKICDLTYQYFEEIKDKYFSCGITEKNEAFVSSSGYGDGSYDCFIKRNKDGKIIAVKIVFIEYDDEDEEFEEDEKQK